MAATATREPDARRRPSRRDAPDRRRRRRWSDWLVIAVPAATAFVVGGYEIGGPSLWRDEAYTKDAIGRPFSQIFALLGHQDAVHGAYYLLMHVIAAVTGTSATALRFPSLCAMVIATGFTAAIGRRAAALALPRRRARAAGLGRPGADRPAVRPAVRDRALHDLLRADGQVLRDRDDVRHDRHLPAAPGLSRRPLAVVVGVRGRRGADRPVQHLRAADPGRARRDAAADRRPRPVRARDAGSAGSRCAGWPPRRPRWSCSARCSASRAASSSRSPGWPGRTSRRSSGCVRPRGLEGTWCSRSPCSRWPAWSPPASRTTGARSTRPR